MESKLFSNLFIFFVLLLSSWAGLGFCQGGSGPDPSKCVQKLLPCRPYLRTPTTAPPTCCLPLKDMVINDAACLCRVISNAAVLKSFNITQDDAFKLAKACGASTDTTVCKSATSPSSGPVPPPTTDNSSTNGTTKAKSAGQRMHKLEKSTSYIAAFFAAFIFFTLLA